MTDIIKQGAQILNPAEYERMREKMNSNHKLIFDGMLFTGMRTVEFWRFMKNPDWFHPDRQYVELPPGSMLKKKAKQQERTVLLSNMGTRAIRDLVTAIRKDDLKPMTREGWTSNVKRAAINSGMLMQGIMPKMTRKTWISWLMVTYPEDGLRVAASSGHSVSTMQRHYLNLPFSTTEKEQIRGYVIGWGGRT